MKENNIALDQNKKFFVILLTKQIYRNDVSANATVTKLTVVTK